MEELIFKYFPSLTEKQKEQFKMLYPLYKEWNSKINVISRTDIENLYSHHILHSLAIAKFMEEKNLIPVNMDSSIDHIVTLCGSGNSEGLPHTVTIMDVGTGGGMPGIPLAIIFPMAKFLLVDSVGKKIKVAEEISKAVGLRNVTAVQARVEELDLEKFFGVPECDFVVSRAVAYLDKFMPWVKGKYSKGVIYLKGGDASDGGELDKEIRCACKENGVLRENVEIEEIQKWFEDPYFEGKKVLYFPRKQRTHSR